MKAILFWSTVFLLLGAATFFYVPEVKSYGQTVLKFDELLDVYFVEDGNVKQKVSGLYYNFKDKMHPGLEVSYVQFKHGNTFYVTPAKLTLTEIARIIHRINMVWLWLVFMLGYCFYGLVLKRPSKKQPKTSDC